MGWTGDCNTGLSCNAITASTKVRLCEKVPRTCGMGKGVKKCYTECCLHLRETLCLLFGWNRYAAFQGGTTPLLANGRFYENGNKVFCIVLLKMFFPVPTLWHLHLGGRGAPQGSCTRTLPEEQPGLSTYHPLACDNFFPVPSQIGFCTLDLVNPSGDEAQ